MKLLFIQYQPVPYFGVMSISGYLKNKGIDCQCLIATLENNLLSRIREMNPDIIGFSVLSTEHKWLVKTAKIVKENFKDKPIIVGGIHAIIYPEDLIKQNQYIDFVCTGEGEEILCELLTAIDSGKNINNIRGLFVRDNSKIIYNARREPLKSLDVFREDREIYFSRYPLFINDSTKQFLASRGCPFSCSFCCNRNLQDIFREYSGNTDGYIRKKSPDTVIEEIEYIKGRYPLLAVIFADDLFTIEQNWLEKFCNKYRDKINLPFMCTTRIDLINEEKAQFLKEAGCYAVSIGIETGSERLRREVLNKNLSDEDIIKGIAILKGHDIKLQTSNMFCIPTETPGDAFKTIEFNIKIKTDFAFTTILMPFPKTEIAQTAIGKNLLDSNFSFEDLPLSFFSNSILKIQDKHILENIQRVAYLCIKLPVIIPLMRRLVRFKFLSKVFYFIFHISNFLRYKKERKFSLIGSIKYFYRFRKSI